MVIKAKLSDFTKLKEIAAGGEGKIYELNNNIVAKIYHKARDSKFVQHLEDLSILSNSRYYIAPIDIYVNDSGKCLGFSMKYVNLNDYHLFNNLFNKGFCTSHNVDYNFKMKVLEELELAMKILHGYGITVGDLNQYNLFFNSKSEIILVDTDSYQTKEQPHNGVLLDDIRDWTTPHINDKTDIWAYDILAFWSTTYCHPFKWVAPGNTETLEQRVRAGKSILSKIKDIKIPALYNPPVGDMLKQFTDIFSGRRYVVSFTNSYTPVNVVVKQNIVSNNLNIRQLCTNVTKVNVCDNYIAVKYQGNAWELIETKIKNVTRVTDLFDKNEVYPSNDKYAVREGNELISHSYRKQFGKPEFYYNNGFLSVIDYATDIQWNYNLNNQIGGIDNTQTPVFAKSIVIRDAPIQNFGGSKYLNIPNNNSYSLIQVPITTKNAYYCKGYMAIERKLKTGTKFQILGNNLVDIDIMDYLPYFCVLNGGIIAVPENGFIYLYKDSLILTKFDCSMCTRDSKLYYTNSGILLLESGILYLLNTK